MRAFKRPGLVAGLIAMVLGAALGQSDGGPKFEIADIHASAAGPAGQNQFMRGGFYRGGRYEVRTATMVDLIRTAYGLDADDKVAGGPGWLGKDQFDVIAKAPADATAETLRLMLRNLLADRFSLVVHNDTRPLAAYVLTPGKKVQLKPGDGSGETGCKLQPQPDPPPGPGNGPVAMIGINGNVFRFGAGSYIVYQCRNVSMAEFGDAIRSWFFNGLTNNRVFDQTELKGTWNFDLRYSPKLPGLMLAAVAGSDSVTLFEAIDKQLGLKLELTKVPMPVIAADSVNEKPTDNAPGVTENMPVAPTEFEVADIKPSAPMEPGQGFGRGGCFFCPGGRVNLTNETMADMISLAWNLNGNSRNRIIGLPKSMETVNWDIIAKASTMAPLNAPPNGETPAQQVDFDSMRVMLQALLKDRFKLGLHEEKRPLPGYALVAVKPKLKRADPSNRTSCNEGPGPDGKDPRTTNPAAGRLFTCLNMTMAQFAEQIPNRAGGYFQELPGGVVDATKLDGEYDITLNFSMAGMVGGGGRGGGGDAASGGAGAGASVASDPGGAMSLQEAIEKQLGLKLEPQKNLGTVLVIDHVEDKPTDN